jgi:hypothetical protein
LQEPGDDEEWRKSLTSLLLRGSSLIVIDNVEHTLQSSKLSSALTLETWSDRLLSTNEIVDIPFKATWIANGNNIRLGGDMGSRCYRIRLDAKVSNPSARTGFTHPDLVEYALAHRGEILADLLTIIRFWYVSGQPRAKVPTMRTFSDWAKLLGSILACAGIEGFLANLASLREEADEHEGQWYAFFKAWHDDLGEVLVSTKQLIAHINGTDPEMPTRLAESLPEFLGMSRLDKPASFAMRLGRALSKNVDNCFGEENFRLERARDTHTKLPVWRVVCSGSGQSDPQEQDASSNLARDGVAGFAGDDMPPQRHVDTEVKRGGATTMEQEHNKHQFQGNDEQLFQSPATTASAHGEVEEGRASSTASTSLEHSDASACTGGVGEQLTGSLPKEQIYEQVHARLRGVRRVMTPLGPATVWRNWYGDVGVTLDEGQRTTRLQDLADLLSIEPLADNGSSRLLMD